MPSNRPTLGRQKRLLVHTSTRRGLLLVTEGPRKRETGTAAQAHAANMTRPQAQSLSVTPSLPHAVTCYACAHPVRQSPIGVTTGVSTALLKRCG